MGMKEIMMSKGWKNFMAKLYGLGAAVVIVGAMFKIMHWPGAGPMLVVGLTVEAIIFFFSAFEPPHEEVDWSLVYPELAGMHGDEAGHGHEKKVVEKVSSDPVAQELDKMLSEAKIGPELLESLGIGLKSLGDNTAKLADITDATVATDDYVKNIKVASGSVSELSASYSKAATAMNDISGSTDDLKNYNGQIQSATKNLLALNDLYQLQLNDSSTHIKSTAKFYDNFNVLMDNLNASVEDASKYRNEVNLLAKNLSSLNTVYGNMLSAMTVNR
jgi:gliding motility-associated protein GldL